MTARLVRSIVRAAHCRSTHHYFAIDALPYVGTPAGKRLTTHLLRHHHRYLTGAKDPDVRFRDFQNHVIHVDDGYWGGAPRVAHQWYDRLQRYIRQDRWSDMAHAAGVLSHYFTDPIQPLHTAQTPREKVLHRPIEWSVTKSYDSLFRDWQNDPTRTVFQLSDGPGWLGDAILQSARVANGYYTPLLEDYDLEAGRRDPASGLTDTCRGIFSQLIGLSITGWARVLERAAMDSEAALARPIPACGLNIASALAGIRVPSRLWIRRIEHKIEQRKVLALIDEFQHTGRLIKNLPTEVRVIEKVRAVHHREREYLRNRVNESQIAAIDIRDVAASTPDSDVSMIESVASQSEDVQVVPFIAPDTSDVRLRIDDNLVDAPSIGPKTAARFEAIGIRTVGDFLDASPTELVSKLAARWITDAALQAWRCQTILMCQLPEMLARETQLLVGAGYSTADRIARAKPSELHEAITAYAGTYAGSRHLRGASPPSIEKIETWITDAALAMVQQKRGLARLRSQVDATDTQSTSRRAA